MFGIFRRRNTDHRPAPVHMGRSFAAAEVSRILAPWRFDGGFSNDEIRTQLQLIRSRARDRHKNDEYFTNFVRLFKNNVVGRGFLFKAQPSVSLRDPTVDDKAKKFLEYHFWRWSMNRRECDFAGRLNLAAMLRLMAGNWARDGEAIAIIERDTPGRYGIQLRLIRPDALDESFSRDYGAADGTVIINGVEIDRVTHFRVAYWFKSSRTDPAAIYVDGNRHLVRIPARDVIHLYSQEDAAQVRGVSLMHASLKKGRMLDEFNNSELVAAIDETNTLGTFKDKQGRSPTQAGFGAPGEGEGVTDEQKAAYTMKSEPGTKLWLDGDIDFSWNTPQHPNREVGPFKKSMLRDIACGLGVDYPIFANDLGEANYSSIRAGTIAMRDNWRVSQDDFIAQVMTPLYEAWLAAFLARPVANPYVPSDFDRLIDHEFQGRTWDWVDPLKDVNAAVIAVDHGWKTNEEITPSVRTRSGS